MSILQELKVNRSVVKFVPIRLGIELYMKKFVTTDCL